MKTNDGCLLLEGLEPRIAPASLLHYTDVDGDQVTVSASKGTLTGHATFAAVGDGQQLQKLDLTNDAFAHANIKVTVKKSSGGDGFANLGFIDATGNDLGMVDVRGDLGKIAAGDGNAATGAIKSLKVHSMGQFGTVTQGRVVDGVIPGPVVDLLTDLLGDAHGTLNDLQSHVTTLLAGDTSALPDTVVRLLSNLNSNIDTLTSNPGDLSHLLPNGTTALENISHDVTTLLGTPSIGTLLGTPLTDQLNQVNTTTGQIFTDLPPGVVPAVNPGDLLGQSIGALGGITIGGTNAGTVINNTSNTVQSLLGSGDIGQTPQPLQDLLNTANTQLAPVLAGTAPFTSDVAATLANLQNETASELGFVNSAGSTISGATSTLLDTLNTELGTILGGSATSPDPNFDLTSNINGSVGSLRIDTSARDVFLNVAGDLQSAMIGGSLIGHQFSNGGELFVGGHLGSVQLGKDLMGGEEVNTGEVVTHGAVNSVMIRGSLIGGAGDHSGALSFAGDVHAFTVRGDLAGSSGLLSGSIVNSNGGIGNMMIHGTLTSGDASDSGTLRVTDAMKLKVNGDIIGDSSDRVNITAAGLENKHRTEDFAFDGITVGGSVNFASFLAGYGTTLNPLNGDAQIDHVSVKGNWLASNLAAGAESTSGPGTYGNASDATILADDTAEIIARIANLQIHGSVFGTTASGDHYGFVAQEIDHAMIGKVHAPLTDGPHNDVIAFAEATGDVTLREVS